MQNGSGITTANDVDTKYVPEAKQVKMMNGGPQTNGGVADGKEEKRVQEDRFLRNIFELMMREGISKPLDNKCKVVEYKDPQDVKNLIDLTIRDDPETSQRLLELCQEVFDYSVKVAHPQFYNQLFAGQDTYGLAGAWMTECLNESQYTFEVAPVFTMMEQEVLGKLRRLCGFETGDAIFCPGGSTANMVAINLARYKVNPDYKIHGNFGSAPLTMFASDQSHYSILKAAAFMGFGTENVVKVKTDDCGRMIPDELDKAIVKSKANGAVPLIVIGTSGTTVFGAYDPLEPIADICEKYGLWLHIDAAWGGGALLSQTYRHYLKGIHRSNSVTWCPHKMMGAPLQCSALLINGNEDLMPRCMSAKARYLFQQDKFYDVSFDTGDKSLQCGRKVDAFKLWMMFKAKGNKGFEAEIDHKFALSRHLTELIKKREGFELVLEPQCTNVCFWYVPPCMRNQEKTPEYWQRLSKVAPIIKERMVRCGSMLVGYQPNGSLVNFFRMIFSNSRATKESIGFVVEEIDRLGKDIEV